MGKCLLLAPHFFLFEQQATSHRNGYNRLQDNRDLLPLFEEEAVDKIPFAWVDAFAGRSPHCRAFGIALAPIKHKYKQFLDEGETSEQIYSCSTSETHASNKLAAHATTPSGTMRPARTRSFDAQMKWRKWAIWCDFGFVMWDRDRVEELKADSMESFRQNFEQGWINAEALLDTMANAKLTKQGKIMRYPGWMVGSSSPNNGPSIAYGGRTLEDTLEQRKERAERKKDAIKQWEEANKRQKSGVAE